jgi:hypothetical protein
MNAPLVTHVGQELWFVPADSRHVASSCSVKVLKIGRKWATVEETGYGDQCNLESGWINHPGYSSPGRCWPSKEAWETERQRQAEWNNLQRRLTRSPPDHLSLDDIKALTATLFPEAKSNAPGEK